MFINVLTSALLSAKFNSIYIYIERQTNLAPKPAQGHAANTHKTGTRWCRAWDSVDRHQNQVKP